MNKNKLIIYLTLVLTCMSLNLSAQDQGLFGLWAKRSVFGSGGNATITSTVQDEYGNVYVAGSYNGTLNFNEDICSPIKHIASGTSGSFLIKYDANGLFQWDINVDAPDNLGAVVYSLDYKNGKLLLSGLIAYSSKHTLPIKSTITGPVNSKDMYLSTINGTGAAGTGISRTFIQKIDATDGRLETTIEGDLLQSGTHNIVSRIEGNKIVSLRWWPVRPYDGANSGKSIVSSFDLNTGALIEELTYPGQVSYSDGFRVHSFNTLPNTDRVVLHQAISGSNYTRLWVSIYSSDFKTMKKIIEIQGSISSTNPSFNTGYMDVDSDNNIFLGQNLSNSSSDPNIPTKPGLYKFNSNLIKQWGVPFSANVFTSGVKTSGGHTYVVGQFKGVAEFNPLNLADSKTLTTTSGTTDGFYAVYDNNNGHCVYATLMGGSKDDLNSALYFSENTKQVVIGGTYKSPLFQTDPSGRLFPLNNSDINNAQGFLALYSIDPKTSPSEFPRSFGDAPEQYGSAVHNAYPCLSLGSLDLNKVVPNPIYDMLANSEANDDGIHIPLDAQGTVDLSHPDFQIDASGNLNVKVKATNKTAEKATLLAWIDFDRNGIFDSGEASTTISVPINSIDSTFIVKWTGATGKIRNGKTYLRARISTETFTASQAVGVLQNGEVEDYALNFDVLEISKTVDYPDGVVAIDDILNYTIKVKSKINLTASIFDPIPSYTSYISSSGVSGTVSLNGKTIPSANWSSRTFNANQEYTFTFSVKVTETPITTPDFIYNVAFAVSNGDTIPSTGVSCNTLPVPFVAVKAIKDFVSVPSPMSVDVEILKNDKLGACDINTILFDTIANAGPLHGTLETNIKGNGIYTYTPKKGFFGIDSASYYIKCGVDSSATKIYFLVVNPKSQQYVACPGANVAMSMGAIPGVTYNWLNTQTGVTVGSNIDTLKIQKNSVADIGTWWVEPNWQGIVFPRLQVDLLLASGCGSTNPSGCTVDGTLLWKEDFGGNSPNDPIISLNNIPQMDPNIYKFITSEGFVGSSVYSVRKRSLGSPDWLAITSDHTSPDPTKGYFLMVDANQKPGQFYEYNLENLCEGTKLNFSVWVTSMLKITSSNNKNKTNLKFLLEDNGVVISEYTTGNVPDNVSNKYSWKNYGFEFIVPSHISSLKLRIINNSDGSVGNDFVLDDIEIYLCAPKVSIEPGKDTIVCQGANLELKLEKDYDGQASFSKDLEYKWQHKPKGSTIWNDLMSGAVNDGEISVADSRYIISDAQTSHEGYYRLLVATSGNLNSVHCRAVSDSFNVEVRTPFVLPDVRIQACPSDTAKLNLSTYLNVENYDPRLKLEWFNVTQYAPFVNPVGEIDLNFTQKIHAYRYIMSNECYSRQAKLYITSLDDHTLRMPPERVVVCKDFADIIHINQIMGIAAGGDFSSSLSPEQASKYLVDLTGTPFLGATILNGTAVWNDTDPATKITKTTYKGVPAIIVTFTYKTSSTSCLVNKTYTLEVIITENIVN